jgi:hypothetical protein
LAISHSLPHWAEVENVCARGTRNPLRVPGCIAFGICFDGVVLSSFGESLRKGWVDVAR